MAGNVYENLKALGCEVDIVCGSASRKTRLIDNRSKQQLLRMDEDYKSIPIVNVDTNGYDAVVISDYNKGVVSYDLIEKIIEESKHSNKFPVFIDTKKTDLDRMQGAWVKINELEYSKIKSECTGLIVTKGSKGAEALYFDYISQAPNVEVVDVTGAGDTFLAALAYNYLHTRDIKRAMDFANLAAAAAVQHFGCYAPTMEEIL
jgi:D-beta-D-heptose 7-phosphate kinase/D-beta-D-heptose 1-phosphate adenosyltransferase